MSTSLQHAPMAGVEEGASMDNSHPIRKKRPAPLTHDISLVGEHAESIKSVAESLQAAVDETWATRGQSRYSQVYVLMLSWKDDDLNVTLEIRQLEAIFTASYHYSVESWEIPHEKPATRLQLRMAEFLRYDGPDALLIIYYAGHAVQDEQRSEPPIWISRRKDPARLPSVTVQSVLSECDSDVLLLYDCCHAVPTTTGTTGRGVKEFLAACGFEGIAPEVGEDSFTHALIQELGKASYSSISVGELHGRLIDRLRTWKPCISTNESGQMRLNSAGKPLYERSRRKTPIHCALTNEPRRRSIILSPLPIKDGLFGSPILSDPSSTIHSSKKKRYQHPTENDDSNSGTRDIAECTQVILSIRVNSVEEFNIGNWLEWIRDVPPEATKIKIEGIYGSLSTLILLRMSIATWNLLPEDSAYTFIGFVTIENLVPAFQSLDPKSAEDENGSDKSENSRIIENESKIRESADIQEQKRPTKGASENIAPSIEGTGVRPSTTTLSWRSAKYSSRRLWECCQCGESGMSTAIDFCPSDGHVQCTNCETYDPKR